MLQKAGSTDNTLGLNGWQSADHWFVANIDPSINYEAGQMAWVNLGAPILKHLSFTNYRISAKRDGGKICVGVLSGGIISTRPDGAKKLVAVAAASFPLNSDLPDPFTKTQVDVNSMPEVSSRNSQIIKSHTTTENVHAEFNTAISLPELPKNIEKPKQSGMAGSVSNDIHKEKKPISTLLFLIIGLAVLVTAIGGYFLTKETPSAPVSTSEASSKAEESVSPATPVTAAPPAPTPPVNIPAPIKNSPSNISKPTADDPPSPDLNKIIKDAINK